jgi:hypothetical protein
MLFIDILSTAFATIIVMVILQVLLFVGIKLMYPPPPQIIYRDVPVYQQQQVPEHQVFTELPQQEIKLPEYEPALKSASTNIRVDPELPLGIKETRPPGT